MVLHDFELFLNSFQWFSIVLRDFAAKEDHPSIAG